MKLILTNGTIGSLLVFYYKQYSQEIAKQRKLLALTMASDMSRNVCPSVSSYFLTVLFVIKVEFFFTTFLNCGLFKLELSLNSMSEAALVNATSMKCKNS